MANLTKILPQDSKTVEAIYAAHKRKGDSESPRGYLGASIIGNSCERYLWYVFRYACRPEFSGRMYRLFETGDYEEKRFVSDLRSIGCEVHDKDESGNQFEVTALGGHFSGHMDGCAVGIPEAPKTWHVLEFKTHNTKSFANLKKEGVKKAKPQHFGQMQAYMGLTGMTRALYLAKDKDTDELYSERVEFDKAFFDSLMDKAKRIIESTAPPERISTRQDYYECGYCDAKKICWGSQERALPVPELNCRQCCHATAMMDGKARWVCEKHKRGLSEADQKAICEDHLCLPGLFAFAEPIDGTFDWIEFQDNNIPGAAPTWKHGKGGFTSKELSKLTPSALTNQTVGAAKDLFGAECTSCTNVLGRYPEGDSRTIWRGKQKDLPEEWRKAFGVAMVADKQVAKEDEIDYRAVEFEGGRLAIIWQLMKPDFDAEIRQGVE